MKHLDGWMVAWKLEHSGHFLGSLLSSSVRIHYDEFIVRCWETYLFPDVPYLPLFLLMVLLRFEDYVSAVSILLCP
jgi:hypothetical protein